MHPAILSKGGLGPALKTLARRCPVPAHVDVAVERRLPEPVEVAASSLELTQKAVTHLRRRELPAGQMSGRRAGTGCPNAEPT
jgi:hypothetical protein